VLQTACGLPKNATHAVGIRSQSKFYVQMNVAAAANINNPVPMDLVFVLDKKLIKEIGKLAAKDWFERRIQIQRDYATTTEIISWEFVPGQHTGAISIDVHPKAKAAFLFANYLSPGENRAVVDIRVPVVVNLMEEGFTVQPLR
jgi:hypothetical protein